MAIQKAILLLLSFFPEKMLSFDNGGKHFFFCHRSYERYAGPRWAYALRRRAPVHDLTIWIGGFRDLSRRCLCLLRLYHTGITGRALNGEILPVEWELFFVYSSLIPPFLHAVGSAR